MKANSVYADLFGILLIWFSSTCLVVFTSQGKCYLYLFLFIFFAVVHLLRSRVLRRYLHALPIG
jgi:hypothetical protein